MISNDITVVTADFAHGQPDYAIPGNKKYPVKTAAQAASSLAKAKGTSDEGLVRKVVCRRYPNTPGCKMVKSGAS